MCEVVPPHLTSYRNLLPYNHVECIYVPSSSSTPERGDEIFRALMHQLIEAHHQLHNVGLQGALSCFSLWIAKMHALCIRNLGCQKVQFHGSMPKSTGYSSKKKTWAMVRCQQCCACIIRTTIRTQKSNTSSQDCVVCLFGFTLSKRS